jgi:hypothetical protein
MDFRKRFDPIDQEQLAAQVVALMDAHFQRPSIEEKSRILNLAAQQIEGSRLLSQMAALARPDEAGEEFR